MEGSMTSIRVRHTLRVLCCLFVLAAHPLGAAGQGVKYVQDLAKNGKFQQAFAQCRAVLAATPSADDLSRLRTLFAKYPGVQESGVAAISSSIDATRNEQDLLRAQSEVLIFAKCVKSSLCDPSVLAALQSRFVAAASRLVIEAGIPVTFESNLVVDWAASTGSDLDKALERRIYQNTLANIAARDPRDTPSVLMTDRLFRYYYGSPKPGRRPYAQLRKWSGDGRISMAPCVRCIPDWPRSGKRRGAMPKRPCNSTQEVLSSVLGPGDSPIGYRTAGLAITWPGR